MKPKTPVTQRSGAGGRVRAAQRRRRGFPLAASIPPSLSAGPAQPVPLDGPAPRAIGALAGSAPLRLPVTTTPAVHDRPTSQGE
jgi:hypothetical protein